LTLVFYLGHARLATTHQSDAKKMPLENWDSWRNIVEKKRLLPRE
jgi:hypothetical protein